jgi:hypothetical protein
MLLGILVMRFVPAGQIQLRGAQLQGIVGSYDTPFTIKASWTTDYTVTPNATACTAGGVVAGQVLIHLHFPPSPDGYDDPTHQWYTSVVLTATEKAGKYPVQPLYNGPVRITHDPTLPPSCGDTAGTNYPEFSWATASTLIANYAANGAYTIAATLTYTSTSDATIQVTANATADFDVENVIVKKDTTDVVPNNPDPVMWNPDPNQPSSQTKTLTGLFTAAAKANCIVKLTIYDIRQALVRKAQWSQVIGSGSTLVTYTWDGIDKNGLVANPGLYLYQWEVDGLLGYESDKTSMGGLSVGAFYTATPVSDDGTTAVYTVNYSINAYPVGYITDLTRSIDASSGAITVYDSELNKVTTQALSGTDLTPTSHAVSVSVPSPKIAGSTTFLISATAGDYLADYDIGHRHRYTLQCGQTATTLKGAIAWVHGDMSAHADYFSNAVQTMKYTRVPKYSIQNVDPYITTIRGPLEFIDPTTSLKPLKIVLMSGHGASDGMTLELRGPGVSIFHDFDPNGTTSAPVYIPVNLNSDSVSK